jgi:hypothetical protein
MRRVLRFCLGLLLISMLVPSLGSADSITFNLDFEFSGAVAPVGPSPWVTITIDDSLGPVDGVRITMDAVGLTGGSGGESIKSISLNFDPLLDPTDLTFISVGTPGVDPGDVDIFTAVDNFMADGDGFFDILFDFPPPPGQSDARFTGGETVEYDVSFSSAITASSFDFFSKPTVGGGPGAFQAAAQIQRIDGNGTESGWIGPIPEPGTALLVGLGLMGLGLKRRR